MPPRTPPVKPRTPSVPVVPAAPEENALVQALEQKDVVLASTAEKLDRLTSAQAALNGERRLLSSQLRDERTQFGDIAGYLKHALDEQTARAEGLQARLAEAQAALQAAAAAAQEAARAAEQRHAAEEAQWQARLEDQGDRLKEAEEFSEERAALQARADQLTAQLEAAAQAHHKRQLDLERKHAGDREVWRRDTQAAVRAAREEMAALADQRLDATTQRTILDNESMAAELQYQGRYVQGLLSRNTALQAEAEEQRLALDISRAGEEELARKGLACERVADSLMARLAAVEAQRAEDEQALDEERERVRDAREEARVLKLKMEDQQQRLEELEAGLAAKRRELKQVKAGQSDAAGFLLKCLADVRQELLAGRERTVLVAAAAVKGSPTQQQQQQQASSEDGRAGEASPAAAVAAAAAAEASAAPLLLAELSVQQRQATLHRLLQLVRPDWQDSEGLVLHSSSSPSTSSISLLAEASSVAWSARGVPSQPSARTLAGKEQGCHPGRLAACPLQAASFACSGSAGCLAGDDGGAAGCKPAPAPASAELMQRVRSEVRPWGEGGASPRGGARPPRERG